MKPRHNAIAIEVRSNYEFEIYGKSKGANYRDFPLRFSVPTAAGLYLPEQNFELRDEKLEVVPSLIRPFVLWPDGSVRAWEVWLPLTLNVEAKQEFVMQAVETSSTHLPPEGSLQQEPSQFDLIVSLTDGTQVQEKVFFDATKSGEIVHHEEQTFVLATEGTALFKGLLQRRRWSFYPGVELSLRLTNQGSSETLAVKSVRLEFDLPLADSVQYTVEQLFHSRHREVPHLRFVHSVHPFVLRANHADVRVTDIARLDEDEAYYPRYERSGIAVVSPWIAASDQQCAWLVLVDEACERFPKQWAICGKRVVIDLHPEDAHPLEWRQGMSMFQRLHLVQLPAASGGETSGEIPKNEALAWQRPPLVRLDADQYRAAGWRIPFRYMPERFPRIENTFRDLFRFDWYPGTFYWGDESDDLSLSEYLSLPPQERPRARPRNGEYDITAASAKEFARTGRAEFSRMCRNAAEHLMYTDFVAVSNDPWKEGGVPAHSRNHTSGAAYPSHMWIEGLTLYYQLSGDRYALEVARRIGDFELKYIAERLHEGLNASPREGGWALIALSALFDLTSEERYLEGMKRVVDLFIDRTPEQFFPTYGSFMIGIAMIGLDRARHYYRDDDVQRFVLSVLDWQIENRMTPDGLFSYHYDSERDASYHIQATIPEAFNIGYLLSGDERYLRISLRQFQFWQAGTLFHVLGSDPLTRDSRLAACAHLSWMGCLQSFAEKGWLDRMQFDDPTR